MHNKVLKQVYAVKVSQHHNYPTNNVYETGMNEGWQAGTNEGQVGQKTAGGDKPQQEGMNDSTQG